MKWTLSARWLWIAFKLFNFDLLKQLQGECHGDAYGCELLSNYLILTYWNSSMPATRTDPSLWIAFKLFNFDLLKQRSSRIWFFCSSLWIAFKLFNFDLLKQLVRCASDWDACCELLSNYLILTYWNSPPSRLLHPGTVVNCFQTI